jgi:predicted acylesterase/phospholipase RssA
MIMKRTLVLNSGASWAAYHIGALEFLVEEQNLSFDCCAGTGIGAMNAAFVACDAFAALKEFWHDIGWFKLISVNWRHPWQEAPFIGEPQAEFIARHVSEKKLRANDATLVFNTMDLNTGQEETFTYPGGPVPLIDALRGATAVPGCTRPLVHGDMQLVEGTFINSFLVSEVLAEYPAEDVYAVAALPAGRRPGEEAPVSYSNWREIMRRSLQLNLSRDVRVGLEKAEEIIAAARAHARVGEKLEKAFAEQIEDEAVRDALETALSKTRQNGAFPYRGETPPELYKITTSRPIQFPMWRFKENDIRQLMDTGYDDAVSIVNAVEDLS